MNLIILLPSALWFQSPDNALTRREHSLPVPQRSQYKQPLHSLMSVFRFPDRTLADKGLLNYCNIPVAWNKPHTWIHITVHGCDDRWTLVWTNKASRVSRVLTCKGFHKGLHDGSSTTSFLEYVPRIMYFFVFSPLTVVSSGGWNFSVPSWFFSV